MLFPHLYLLVLQLLPQDRTEEVKLTEEELEQGVEIEERIVDIIVQSLELNML